LHGERLCQRWFKRRGALARIQAFYSVGVMPTGCVAAFRNGSSRNRELISGGRLSGFSIHTPGVSTVLEAAMVKTGVQLVNIVLDVRTRLFYSLSIFWRCLVLFSRL